VFGWEVRRDILEKALPKALPEPVAAPDGGGTRWLAGAGSLCHRGR
jgi:hypothetical protein